jgi:hypothetical protein
MNAFSFRKESIHSGDLAWDGFVRERNVWNSH